MRRALLGLALLLVLAAITGCMDFLVPQLDPMGVDPSTSPANGVSAILAAVRELEAPTGAPAGVAAKLKSAEKKLEQAEAFIADGKNDEAREKLLGAIEQLCGGAVPQVDSLRCGGKKGRCIADDAADEFIEKAYAVCDMIDDVLWPPPIAVVTANPLLGSAPLEVSFDGSGSYDEDGVIVAYAWDFGDGSTGTESQPSHTYVTPGTYVALLTVTDNSGKTGTASVVVEVSMSAILYYDFQTDSSQTVQDLSGNENHGANEGASWVLTETGGALEFDGSDRVGIPTSPSLRSLTYPASFFISFRRSEDTDGYLNQVLLCNEGAARTRGATYFFIAFVGERHNQHPNSVPKQSLQVKLSDGSRTMYNFTTTPITDSDWHSCVVILREKDSPAEIYLDGQQLEPIVLRQISGSGYPTRFIDSDSVWIADNGWGHHWFDGTIGHVGIYGRALSATEIDSLNSLVHQD